MHERDHVSSEASSRLPTPVNGITVLSRASIPRISIPHKRVAGFRGLPELHLSHPDQIMSDTSYSNQIATSPSPQIKLLEQQQNAASSPQSSATPGSAKTDLSFASTAPLLSPSSAVTPASATTKSPITPASATTSSPMTPSSPETLKFTCPDCDDKFRTPGQLKYIPPFPTHHHILTSPETTSTASTIPAIHATNARQHLVYVPISNGINVQSTKHSFVQTKSGSAKSQGVPTRLKSTLGKITSGGM
jgi:hypothetical protein